MLVCGRKRKLEFIDIAVTVYHCQNFRNVSLQFFLTLTLHDTFTNTASTKKLRCNNQQLRLLRGPLRFTKLFFTVPSTMAIKISKSL